MIEHQQWARPLVHEIKATDFLSGAASRSVPLLMPHLNLTYEALQPIAASAFARSSLRFGRLVILVVVSLRGVVACNTYR